jgi:hypothetical protein
MMLMERQGNQIMENKMFGACRTHGEMINAYKILDDKPEGMTRQKAKASTGKRPLGRPMRRWKKN